MLNSTGFERHLTFFLRKKGGSNITVKKFKYTGYFVAASQMNCFYSCM